VKITNAYDNILTVRSSVGSRLAELETLDASGAAQQLANQSYLSQLQDLDYAGAISEFTQRQTNLQATQQTFARLQGINLFNYLT
jgi:flagellar hook-associated protein 3 FlgL